MRSVLGKKSRDKSEMSEALEWIKESLQDVLDDRDEESSEGIPLVPLTDHSSAAMDSPSFQKLLRAMAFLPPSDFQESFWRIPASMLTTTIQKRCKLIENALAGEFLIEGKWFSRVGLQTRLSNGGHLNTRGCFIERQIESCKGDDSDIDGKLDSEDDIDVFENVKKFFLPKG